MPTNNQQWLLTQSFYFQNRLVKWDSAGTGEPLIVVHGTPWSSYNMRFIIRAMAQHYQVYYFDLLGFGQSDQSDQDCSLGIQNDLLSALIQHWKLRNPLIVGHDFGGTTALRTALLNQQEFGKIALIDPVAIRPWGSDFYRLVATNEEVFQQLPAAIHKGLVRAYIETAAFTEISTTVIDHTLSYWSTELGQPAFYRQIKQSSETYTAELEDKFCDLGIETLIIWAEQDSWLPVSYAQKLANALPNAQVSYVADAGHLVIEEKPTELVQKLRSFFAN
ncbi:MAG: alpha/beta hydrolase [Idiomarina sp.]